MDESLQKLNRSLEQDPENMDLARQLAATLQRSGLGVEGTLFEHWLGEIKLGQIEVFDKLAALGPQADFAVPSLIKALGHKQQPVRALAQKTLNDIGPIAAPLLIEALSSGEKYSRKAAANLVRAMAPRAKHTLEQLIETLNEGNKYARKEAAKALGSMGFDAQQAFPHLTQALDDKYKYVRREALIALGKVQPELGELVPAIVKALEEAGRAGGSLINQAFKR